MISRNTRVRSIGQILVAAGLVVAPVFAHPGEPAAISEGAVSMLERALGAGASPANAGGGRALFEAVLASEAFRSGSVGPFDVHVLVGAGRSAVVDADTLRDEVLATLVPASDLVARLWPEGGEGLISATRFPIVLVTGEGDYRQLVSLLDHCERAGYSGWSPANVLDSPAVRAAEVAHTWEVQVFNLANKEIAQRRDAWLDHGVGYYSLAFVANRALRRGAWGLVPPWLSAGLIDELDVAAYGEAWVGEASWTRQTPGWSRSGWSGFVPEGCQPPPPLVGPPADLAVTVKSTGNSWLAFAASRTRHWTELVADLKSEAPASFLRAAETESFLPRDRAAARCLLHLVLSRPDGKGAFTALLDHPAEVPAHGMPDSDPLPAIFALALGGVPEVERLEALDTRSLLTELGRQDLIDRLELAKAGDALALNDHREQAQWLFSRVYDGATRNRLFQSFLEIEYLQQMAEWKALGSHLDSGLRAALRTSVTFPSRPKDATAVWEAFCSGLVERVDEPSAADAAIRKKAGKRTER